MVGQGPGEQIVVAFPADLLLAYLKQLLIAGIDQGVAALPVLDIDHRRRVPENAVNLPGLLPYLAFQVAGVPPQFRLGIFERRLGLFPLRKVPGQADAADGAALVILEQTDGDIHGDDGAVLFLHADLKFSHHTVVPQSPEHAVQLIGVGVELEGRLVG